MYLQADPMAGPVAESFSVARLGDHPARDRVDFLAARARPDRIERRLLGPEDQLIELAGLVAGIAGRVGPGAVRAVPVELRAHIEDDELTRSDLALAGLGVRQRPVRRARHDRRERRLRAELPGSASQARATSRSVLPARPRSIAQR